MNEDLKKWNTLLKRQDGFYHRCAKKCGLPDAQFWLLYALCEGGPLCQNTFCENWCYSKQTVSAASAGLKKAGLIFLTYAEGSRKQKELRLTSAGEEFCEEHIRIYLKEEEKALSTLKNEERAEFFRLYEQLLSRLEEADAEGEAHA